MGQILFGLGEFLSPKSLEDIGCIKGGREMWYLIEGIDFALCCLELFGYFVVIEGSDAMGFKILDILFCFLKLILQNILKPPINIPVKRRELTYQFVILLFNFFPQSLDLQIQILVHTP
jgi:hypothetical protein